MSEKRKTVFISITPDSGPFGAYSECSPDEKPRYHGESIVEIPAWLWAAYRDAKRVYEALESEIDGAESRQDWR